MCKISFTRPDADEGDEDEQIQEQTDQENDIMLSKEDAEKRFSQDELSQIRMEFDKLSKDEVIGKRKLMEYLRLTEINETYLTNELFMLIKNSAMINSPIDWTKFISFMSMAAKGTKMEKLRLIFVLIDRSPDSKLTKDELKSHIGGTLVSMIGIQFEDPKVEVLKQNVLRSNEQLIDQAMEFLVDEIFQKFGADSEELTFEEWAKWFTELPGINELLDRKQGKSSLNR